MDFGTDYGGGDTMTGFGSGPGGTIPSPTIAGLAAGGTAGTAVGLVGAGLGYLGQQQSNELNYGEFQQGLAYNSAQAQINRDYQTGMSNTAHQREVADLRAAGLNPILSANKGASSPSGSSASAPNAPTLQSPLKTATSTAMDALSLNNSMRATESNLNLQKMQTMTEAARAAQTANSAKSEGIRAELLKAQAPSLKTKYAIDEKMAYPDAILQRLDDFLGSFNSAISVNQKYQSYPRNMSGQRIP